MLSGHASHQVGLDADVWLPPMPNRTLTKREREDMSAKLVVKDRKTMDYSVWTPAHAKLIKRAASYPQVARIFVHPPIKAELCKWATGDRSWLAKVRPYFGHNYHFHIRMSCPRGQEGCREQDPPPSGEGCDASLAHWFSDAVLHPRKPKVPHKPRPPMTMASLPDECRQVLTEP